MLIPSLILLAGVVDDIFTKKVHNKMFVACVVVATAFCLLQGGVGQLGLGVLSMLTAFVVITPMVLLKVIGAGDLKIMLAFGLASSWQDVLGVVFFSLIWAGVFGLVKATLDGKLVLVFKNVGAMVAKRPVDTLTLNRIPYTVPLFFGWMSVLVNESRWL